MKKKPLKITGSLFPVQELESEDDESWQVSYLDIITIVLGFLIILLSASQITKSEFSSLSSIFGKLAEETEFITTPINQIQEELFTLLQPDIEQENIEIIRDLNDLRIRFRSDDLYLSGQAQLEPSSVDLINRVLIALMQVKYNDFQIDVEGHTDSTPISSETYPSNWELSTARASNIVRYFNESGISSKRLKASGYADSRPVIQYDSLGFPFAASKDINRRVVLRLYYDAENLRQDFSTPIDSSAEEATELTEQRLAELQNDAQPETPDNSGDLVLADQPVILTVAPTSGLEDQLSQQTSSNKTQDITPQATTQNTPPVTEEITPTPVPPTPEPEPIVAKKEEAPRKPEPEKMPPPTNTMPNLLRVDQRCVFSVELAGFDELSRGFQQANSLESEAAQPLEMLYNNKAFSLRTPAISSFSEALELQKNLASTLNNADIGLVHQCYSNTYQRPKAIKYQIQFGAFQNRENGLNYAMSLLDKYGLQAYMDRAGDTYNVMMGPYNTREEVLAEMQQLRDKGVESSIFIKHQVESVSEYKYAYQIQIVTAQNVGTAQLTASQISEATGVNTRVVELIPGQYSVMTGQSTSWTETQTIFNRLRNSQFQTAPVIFVLEYI